MVNYYQLVILGLGGVLRFKVPQNIDIEDRILGPLTMTQFVYAVVGFGVGYILYNVIPAPVSYAFIVPIAFFVVCLDFVKVNERPFQDFLKSALLFMFSPRQRYWHEGEEGADMSIEIYKAVKEEENDYQSKNISHNQISSLAKQLDTTQTFQERK